MIFVTIPGCCLVVIAVHVFGTQSLKSVLCIALRSKEDWQHFALSVKRNERGEAPLLAVHVECVSLEALRCVCALTTTVSGASNDINLKNDTIR